jgi:putative tryptophan/tyrosine transport system substrate-binding protein
MVSRVALATLAVSPRPMAERASVRGAAPPSWRPCGACLESLGPKWHASEACHGGSRHPSVLLKEVAPQTLLVAVLWNATNPAHAGPLGEAEAAAQSLGLQLQSVEVRTPSDLDLVFEAMASTRPSALITLADGMLLDNRARIVAFAAKNRLPGIFPDRDFAEVGGLMTYGPSLAANFRRAAAFVDKILKGAKPADLPVECPMKFQQVINLKTAKALGLTIPPPLLFQAEEVIQ